jgi:glycosyltransferase involved in cell wall biosynthesis
MNVLHTIAGLWRGTGGPARSVPGLCRALAREGVRVTLVTGAGELAPDVLSLPSDVRVRVVPLGPAVLAEAGAAFARACLEEARSAQIVHNHGLWRFPNWAAAWSAARARTPLVISPRGMLTPWALQHGRWRKTLAWALLERRAFRRAAFVHASSGPEAEAIRRRGVGRPVAVVPNGLDLDEFPETDLERARAAPAARLTVLYLGRIHLQKGWDLLLAAWRSRGLGARADLVLAGSGRPADVAALEAALRPGSGDGVRFIGALDERERLAHLAAADVVVLPSHSESYGMAVAEALACRTPVVTTTGTPWAELVEERCGWWVEPRSEAVGRALDEALSLPRHERRAMGDRGRKLIESRHSLRAASRQILEAYRWSLGDGPLPHCVQVP